MALDSSLALLQGLPGKTPKSMAGRVAHKLASLPISGSPIATQPPIVLPRIWSDGHSSDLILDGPARAVARMILGDDEILVIKSVQRGRNDVGRPCTSLRELLRTINSDPVWAPILRTRGAHACHGDLILEDILLKPGAHREVKLVDPNPYNQHGLLESAASFIPSADSNGGCVDAFAIPSFHVIRRRRPDCALAFLSLGLLHASHALARSCCDSA